MADIWQKTINSKAEQYEVLYLQQVLITIFWVIILPGYCYQLAGLLGLAIYTTNSRTKETGARKILGARVGSIIALLSKDFMKLVSIAFIIAMPVVWWGFA